MTVTATPEAREQALEELRLSLHELLGAHRRLRSRDGRHPGTIGFVHYRLLAELRSQGRLTPSSLAAAADLSPATVTGMLDALVEAGLVERQRDETDRRVVWAVLTPAGRRAFDRQRARFVANWSRELADLDPEAIEGATVVLERLTSFFERL
jgi:DNA-binding MarR family transcriptional regulator